MNWKPILVCAALHLVDPSQVMAADIDAQERAAKKACLLGDVGRGADILADLYVSTNNPTYIYNQGRCFEQNGKNADAVLRFKEYLRKSSGLSQQDAGAVRRKIAELEAGAGAKPAKSEGAAPAALPAALPLPAPTPEARPAGPGSALDLSQPMASPEPPTGMPVYKRWWFWTGVGALVAGGVVTGILLSRKSAPSSPPCTIAGPTCVQ